MPLRPFPVHSLQDADDDGIPNRDDPTPFTPGPKVVWSVEARPLEGDEDGIPEHAGTTEALKRFNFAPLGSGRVSGFTNDHGQLFSDEAGHGWKLAIVQNSRRRNALPEDFRDTFLFTRDRATWECAIDDGLWHVTVCVGDAAHPQPGQHVTIEGVPAVVDVSTAAGQFNEATVSVEVKDGRLTMELGPQAANQNTCVNWIQVVR